MIVFYNHQQSEVRFLDKPLTLNLMKLIQPIISVLSLAALCTLTACDSRQEQAREKALESKADALEEKADATRKGTERVADAVEDQKKVNDKVVDAQADNIRKSGENAADAAEKQADAVRDQK